MKLSHKAAKAAVNLLFRILIRLEVNGKENLPSEGPLIVVANHLHLIDPPLLIVSLPRWISFMAKEELFRSWPYLPVMKWAQAFPAYRKGSIGDRAKALRQAREMLEQGLLVGMFPEGMRSRGAQLLAGYASPVIIASKSGCPLLPVAICGTEKLRGIGWMIRPKVTIDIGQPFMLPLTGELNKSQIMSSGDFVMRHIACLLPQEYRGNYGAELNQFPLGKSEEYSGQKAVPIAPRPVE